MEYQFGSGVIQVLALVVVLAFVLLIGVGIRSVLKQNRKK